MSITKIDGVIKEKNIVVFSPHYDDFTFYMAGYIEELKQNGLLDTKRFTSVLIYGRSNYTNNAGKLNYDTSLERIKYCTGLRLIEDTECMNEMFGRFNYTYECWLEDEALVREKSLADCDMEYAQGSFETFDENDKAIYQRVKKRIAKYAMESDTALVFSVAIKEHIDHFIVREAAFEVFEELKGKAKASFYFCEDKPYFGLASEEERERVYDVIRLRGLQPITFKHHPQRLIDLMFKHYPSQVDEIFKTGVWNRAETLKNENNVSYYCDRIYALKG